MKFQIINIIIWPRNLAFAPQVITFQRGKVNLITGGSRTGKSAIIPIIDYCLASSECQIPIDTIRDHSGWYGVLFETAHEQILLARKGPQGREASDAFFLSRGNALSIPSVIAASNEKLDNVKHLLNTISATPYFRLSGPDDPRPFQERVSFRDLMALVFQSQEIVANQNILFYKMHAYEHRERLKNWLPYILGAENLEVLYARHRLSVIQVRLNQLRKEMERARRVSEGWLSNMTGHIQVAKKYGLLSEEYVPSSNPFDLIEVAKGILLSHPERPQPTSSQIIRASKDVLVLEEQEEKLNDEIGLIRRRLGDIERLKAGLLGYHGSARRRADRLQISQWLEEVKDHAHDCPLCGSDRHDKAGVEIRKISAAFKKIEDEANRTKEIPGSFAREEATLKQQLDEALSKKKSLNVRMDKILTQNKAARADFDRWQSMFFFLGHLKASLETFQSLAAKGEFSEEISSLEDEEKDLLGLANPEGVQRRLQAALRLVAQKTLARLQTLDVEAKYKKIPPEFSIKDLSLKVLSDDGHWHFLAEVGSASNWLSFHVAFVCALHEFFNEMSDSCVPSFAVFDQPSQVYFPKTSRATVDGDNSQYADEDVDAVVGIFKTLAASARSQKGNWQCIVLDHARSEIYGGIDEIHEVAVWRNGEKLIPAHWYS